MTAEEQRRLRVAGELAEAGLDALLVTQLVNVRYLTGFTGSNGALLLRAVGSAVFATDGRYETQARAEVPDLQTVVGRQAARGLVERAGPVVLGFEAHHVTVELHAELAAVDPMTVLRPAGRRVERQRMAKDAAELALLRQACAITDAAFADLLAAVRPGLTERAAADLVERRMREHGADGPAFDTIVATGPNSAMPHHAPTDRPIERGDLVKVDCGALFRGYHADLTRTVVVGPARDWQREIYEVVAAAAHRGREALVAGARSGDVDSAARAEITAAGYGEQFTHPLGHGVGLEIHEAPLLAAGTADTVPARAVVTVEPGIYLPDRGGVRIEDSCLVGPAPAQPLTGTGRELVVL